MTITTSNAYVRVTRNGSPTEYHPGCAVAFAHSRGIDTGLSEDANIGDVARWLGEGDLPDGVTVNIVRPYGEALGTCGQCAGSLATEPESEGEDSTEEGSTAWAYVTTGGIRYTVEEARAEAEHRLGQEVPEDWTLEQAVDYVRRTYRKYADLTLISEDEERQYPEATEEPESLEFDTDVPDFQIDDEEEDEDDGFTLTEDADEDEGGDQFAAFMSSLSEAIGDQESLANSFRAAVAKAVVHALQQDDAEDEAFAKGAAHVAARVLGIDTEAYDWQTFVTTVAAITPGR